MGNKAINIWALMLLALIIGFTVDCGEDGGDKCTPITEVCDGIDNDCDGLVDEDLSPPGECLIAGVCADGASEECREGKWVCEYVNVNYEAGEEKSCDGQDNNCDGSIDEAFSDLGQPCTDGIGVCMVSGTVICKPDGSGTQCSSLSNPDCQPLGIKNIFSFATGDTAMSSQNYMIITDTFEPIGRANVEMKSQDYKIISTFNF